MAENPEPNGPVANPTYMADIRNFFTSDDVTHMGAKGYDLATYDGVKSNASDIYDQTKAGNMPPGQAWSADRVQTFSNWMTSGYPLGSSTTPVGPASPTSGATTIRLRKNLARLSDEEIATLKTAFAGLMDREPSEPDSYFALAGITGCRGAGTASRAAASITSMARTRGTGRY